VLVSDATASLVVESLPHGATLRDLGAHRLKDLGAPEHVRQLCHADLPDEFPPLRSLDTLPNNLPVQLTSFIGRDEELGTVGGLIDRHRLVTLTGAGGCGKTRLAVHTAAQFVEALGGGVWIADLAAVIDPVLVERSVAAAIGVVEQPLQSLTQAIAARISNKPTLLIIDNCEHLADAAAALATTVTASCPGLRILTTSREPLGVDGEVIHRVPSLQLPQSERDAACESVRLFVDRARAVRPTFTLDDATLAPVIEICARLDGLPLAIELAAGRCRAMSPAEMASQLEDRFRLLRGGRRGVMARQQTLEASVRWSYDLLSQPERALLERLSVFAGGFSIEGAEEVGSGDDVDRWDVIDLLTRLVDRSLVQTEEIGGRTRYRLLETIREFASARLAEAGGVASARDRHLDYIAAFTSSTGEEMFYQGSARALQMVMAEAENLRAALEWAVESYRPDEALKIFADTGLFWVITRPSEHYEWAKRLDQMGGGHERDRAMAMQHAAMSAWQMGDAAMAQRLIDHGSHVAEALDDDLLRATVLSGEPRHRMFAGDPTAFEGFEKGVELSKKVGNSVLSVTAYASGGMALGFSGRFAEAWQWTSAAIADCADDHVLLGMALNLHAVTAMFRGEFATAEGLLRSQSTARWSVAARVMTGFVEALFPAWLLSAQGRHKQAVDLLRDELAAGREFAQFLSSAYGGWLEIWLAWRAGEPLDEEGIARADALLGVAGFHFARALLAAIRAEYAAGANDIEPAITHIASATAIVDSSPLARAFRPLVLNTAARVALAKSEPGEAEALAHDALTAYIESDMRWGVPEALETIAAASAALEAGTLAARLLGAAESIRRDVGWARGVPEERTINALELALREKLRTADFDAAYAEGSAMSASEATAYARRGRGERKRPSLGWNSLTPMESQVSELAAQGLRNAEIAERLFVSVTTVKTHLGHVYAKLGLRSRSELAARIRDRAAAR
jgi:predicted ATPase/DNA-binding CsgD family transcriptional regulator